MVNRFAWHAEGLVEHQLNAFFINALLEMRASLILQDEQSSYICVTSLPPKWKIDKAEVPSDELVFGPQIASRLALARDEARRVGKTILMEIDLETDYHFEFRVFCISPHLNQHQYITVIIDRTAERKKQDAMNSLLREINHRSKNLLAIIQGIANHTARRTSTIAGFIDKFRGRLESIARTQDLVTDSDWQGARLGDLLAQQVAWGLGDKSTAIRFSGENLLLSPNATLYIGLALHELTANAIEHRERLFSGAPIKVTCSMFSDQDAEMVELLWVEPGDAELLNQPSEPAETRIDSSILERVVPSALGGRATYQRTGKHAIYALTFPRGNQA